MSSNKPEFDPARLPPLAVARSQRPHRELAARLEHPEQPSIFQPLAYLNVQVDGHETSYFEWLGAGLYSAGSHSVKPNGRPSILHELHYGFSERFFYLRVDAFPGSLSQLRECEFQISLRGSEELRLTVGILNGRFAGSLLDTPGLCILGPHELVQAAFGKILEVAIGRRLIALAGHACLKFEVEFWHEGHSLDILPHEAPLEVKLGADAFAWPVC